MQVPGNRNHENDLPLDEQADILAKKLTGNEIFNRMRGNVSDYPLYNLLDLDSKNTRSASLRKFDSYVSDLRVMRSLVVQLREHRCFHAARELRNALSAKDYIMWCEDIPFNQSEVVTVLMFNPKETMRFHHWLENGMPLSQLGLLGLADEGLNQSTLDLLKDYPSLGEKRYLYDSSYSKIFSTVRKDIVDPILTHSPKALKAFERIAWIGPNFPLYTNAADGVSDRDDYQNGALAYVFPVLDQKEVLSWFPRELQHKLATWQIRIPTKDLRGSRRISLGFYPEKDHAMWQKIRRSLTSKGVSAGMGVAVNLYNHFAYNDFTKEGLFVLNSYK